MAYRNQETLNPAAPVILTVRRRQHEVVFDLSEIEPLIQNICVRFDEQLLAGCISELESLTDSFNRSLVGSGGSAADEKSPAEGITPRFKKLGRIIHDQFFPNAVTKVLSEHAAGDLFLRLEEGLLEIPWELSFDGREFLFQRFRIGRQVITSHPFSRPEGADHAHRDSSRLLIVCDPTESLPAAVEETETLLDILDREESVQVEVLGGRRATKLEVLAALSEFDLVHFAGHSVFHPDHPEESGWVLHDAILTTLEMSKLSNPPLLVFSNSCLSAQTSRWDVPNPLGQAPLGIGGSFLMAGVCHTIGALWVLHDRSSARFAGRFYSRLFGGGSIGEALFHAKGEEACAGGDEQVLRAGYVHYGRPDDRLFDRIEARHDSGEGPQSDVSALPAGLPRKRPGIWTSPMAAPFLVFLLAFVVGLAVIRGIGLVNDWPLFNPILAAYEKAVEDYRNGRVPAAMAAFQQLIKRKDNGSYLGYGDLAEIYLEAGTTNKAREVLDQALSKPLSNSLTYIIEGDLALQGGDAVGAEAAYQKALVMDGSPPYQAARALNALGILHFLGGNNERARDLFTQALGKQGEDPDAEFNLGVLAYLDNDRKRAAELVSAVIDESPQEELATLFSEKMLKPSAGDDSRGVPHTGEAAPLLVGPFYLKGTTLKRLGHDLVLARLLRRHLETTETGRSCPLRESDCSDFVRRTPGAVGADPRDPGLLSYIRSLGAKTAICGNLFVYRHVFYANVKVVDAASGAVLRAIDVRTEDPGKIQKMAEKLGDGLKTPGPL